MGERFSRSWQLVRHSAAILQKDRELMLFPLLSSIAAILVVVSFIPLFSGTQSTAEEQNSATIVVLGLLYLVEYFVMFFFNAALVGAAMIRMDGGDPTVRDGLRIAWSKVGKIFGYAVIAATVGVLLRAIGERFGVLGRIIAGLFGMAWTVASFLAVPVLVSRDIGPVDAVRESASLLKRTWGENVISNAGIGVVFSIVYVVAFCLFGLLLSLVFSTGYTPLIIGSVVVAVIALLLLGLLQAALQGVFSAVLYRFATDGGDADGFSADVLHNAFTPKLN